MLFTSDEDLVRLQQKSLRLPKSLEQGLKPEDYARIAIDDLRELRMHRRLRQFALLFFLPGWIGAAIVILLVVWRFYGRS